MTVASMPPAMIIVASAAAMVSRLGLTRSGALQCCQTGARGQDCR